jgi:hypothetical protein
MLFTQSHLFTLTNGFFLFFKPGSEAVVYCCTNQHLMCPECKNKCTVNCPVCRECFVKVTISGPGLPGFSW